MALCLDRAALDCGPELAVKASEKCILRTSWTVGREKQASFGLKARHRPLLMGLRRFCGAARTAVLRGLESDEAIHITNAALVFA